MHIQRRRFPIPTLWVYVFSNCSLFILIVLAYVVGDKVKFQHPDLVIPVIALLIIAGVFLAVHKIGLFAESRGWIYYRQPRTSGLRAGVALDLEILLSARPINQIENIRKAHLAHNESAQQDGESDKPPEKKCPR